MIDYLVTILQWIPGCSPSVPQTWPEALRQAFTCFVRWCIFALSVLIVAKLIN